GALLKCWGATPTERPPENPPPMWPPPENPPPIWPPPIDPPPAWPPRWAMAGTARNKHTITPKKATVKYLHIFFIFKKIKISLLKRDQKNQIKNMRNNIVIGCSLRAPGINNAFPLTTY